MAGGLLPPGQELRLLHLSDTHNLHQIIEDQYPLPPADVLIHTGDFSNGGRDREVTAFNDWLGTLKLRYPHIIVILGNHDWHAWITQGHRECPLEERLRQVKQLLSNATVLDHESIEVMGLQIFGSGWCPWHDSAAPGDPGKHPTSQQHRFNEIPEGTDILLTHGPPHRIFDKMELTTYSWGSSRALLRHILRARPKVHLFGHVHEQRGVWFRAAAGQPFRGGVEYGLQAGEPWTSFGPPPDEYPCQVVACTAMQNHPGIENAEVRIAGPGRVILARRSSRGSWSFLPEAAELLVGDAWS